jgi:hypothetical protein
MLELRRAWAERAVLSEPNGQNAHEHLLMGEVYAHPTILLAPVKSPFDTVNWYSVRSWQPLLRGYTTAC